MSAGQDWYRDEFRQIGTDYASVDEVASYDARMRKMRNIEAENQEILSLLKTSSRSSILEIGTGTGAFARTAARQCARVTAIDISPVMLSYAEQCAKQEGLSNIRFIQAGFLSFEAEKESFDGAVSSLALHHLPEPWKAVALKRIADCLKPGARFCLNDVIFSWKPGEDPEAYFERIVELAPGSRNNFARHIADEFSTLEWIMDGLFERAGFEVEHKSCLNDFLFCYCGRKKSRS